MANLGYFVCRSNAGRFFQRDREARVTARAGDNQTTALESTFRFADENVKKPVHEN